MNMAGHSKWSKVKHQKAVTDVIKSKNFTKAGRAIIVAVKEGGGITDPNRNFKLRLAIDLARQVNMPKENIERAIAKASGEQSMNLESLVYEAYGPFGSAFIILCISDNRNRTAAVVKSVLQHHQATLVSPGAVMFQFTQSGESYTPLQPLNLANVDEVNALIEALEELEDVQSVYTNVQN
jgi:YebC/PmpR family DNA-binding regulatory protein